MAESLYKRFIQENDNKFPYTINDTDNSLSFYLNINGDNETVQDLLHNSYINDTQVLFRQLNETQGIISDIWSFSKDESIITGTSGVDFFTHDDNGNEVFNWQQVLLDNNILKEQKVSKSLYNKKQGKVIWRELNYDLGKSQLESNVQLTYIYNDEFNTEYRITQGDIIKDPLNPDTFLVVQKQEEQKQIHDNITGKTLYIIVLYASRLNLSTIPDEIYSYYFGTEDNDITKDNKEYNKLEIIEDKNNNIPDDTDTKNIKENEDFNPIEKRNQEDDFNNEDELYNEVDETEEMDSTFDDWIENQI